MAESNNVEEDMSEFEAVGAPADGGHNEEKEVAEMEAGLKPVEAEQAYREQENLVNNVELDMSEFEVVGASADGGHDEEKEQEMLAEMEADLKRVQEEAEQAYQEEEKLVEELETAQQEEQLAVQDAEQLASDAAAAEEETLRVFEEAQEAQRRRDEELLHAPTPGIIHIPPPDPHEALPVVISLPLVTTEGGHDEIDDLMSIEDYLKSCEDEERRLAALQEADEQYIREQEEKQFLSQQQKQLVKPTMFGTGGIKLPPPVFVEPRPEFPTIRDGTEEHPHSLGVPGTLAPKLMFGKGHSQQRDDHSSSPSPDVPRNGGGNFEETTREKNSRSLSPSGRPLAKDPCGCDVSHSDIASRSDSPEVEENDQHQPTTTRPEETELSPSVPNSQNSAVWGATELSPAPSRRNGSKGKRSKSKESPPHRRSSGTHSYSYPRSKSRSPFSGGGEHRTDLEEENHELRSRVRGLESDVAHLKKAVSLMQPNSTPSPSTSPQRRGYQQASGFNTNISSSPQHRGRNGNVPNVLDFTRSTEPYLQGFVGMAAPQDAHTNIVNDNTNSSVMSLGGVAGTARRQPKVSRRRHYEREILVFYLALEDPDRFSPLKLLAKQHNSSHHHHSSNNSNTGYGSAGFASSPFASRSPHRGNGSTSASHNSVSCSLCSELRSQDALFRSNTTTDLQVLEQDGFRSCSSFMQMQVSKLPHILDTFHGHEEDLFVALRAKYQVPDYPFSHWVAPVA